ncbi:hypothetical protein [Janthinobacterium sp.]|uniref:hypothetical protein n=1 Tax=Janthinobacterium sp. TaxID=1871054 RepID=UPI002DB7D5A1|nr:hypothetical protein [Janthinobacterium sp.]HEU4819223.1 hypothetical protein [Janthinobacterium sp.]
MSLSKIFRRDLFRTLATLVIQAVVRLGSSLAVVKILTVFLLPSQFIIYGQIQTLMQLYSAFATSIASTKFSALIAAKETEKERDQIFDTAVFLVGSLSIILFLVTVLFRSQIEAYIAVSGRGLEITLLPFGAFAVAYCTLIQAYFTGIGSIRRFSRNSIIVVLVISSSTVILAALYGENGAMLSVGVSPIIACILIGGIEAYKKIPNIKNIQLSSALEITGFTVSSILTLVGYYFAQLYVRSLYSQVISPHEAGLLMASSRIADVYMGVLAVFFANILTKEYAKTVHNERLKVIGRSYFLFVIFFVPGFLFLASTTSFWLPLLLSDQYFDAHGHMSMQLGADLLKCLYWISIYYVISRLSTGIYFFLELFGLAIYVLTAIWNPFDSVKYSPQLAQMVEYGVLLLLVNVIIIYKKNND